VTRGEGSSTKRKRYWGLAALLIAVGVLGGLVSRKKNQGWLAHRRGEGPSGEARAEIAPRPGDILLFHHVARLRDVLITEQSSANESAGSPRLQPGGGMRPPNA